MSRKLLGALDIAAFMRTHWQRKPLLVRSAFPGFQDPLSAREVLALAGREHAQSRLVQQRGAKWSLEHGPFTASRLKQLPRRNWTVLVQDTNHFSHRAEQLLACFDFIPHARIDDVMVSYAAPGGGVGPHVDSYDVFLLQGHGCRRWQISRQADHTCLSGVPLKVLANFVPSEEWILEAGDMLYLPPGVAHRGIAESECLTWSIGFRAPTDSELVAGLLDYLRDTLAPEGQYRDPGATVARHPGEVPRDLLDHAARVASRIEWPASVVRDFSGRFLTEPKAHVFFDPPARPTTRAAFVRRAARHGLALDPRSRLAFSGRMFYMNGETVKLAPAARTWVRRLADARRLPGPIKAPAAFWDAAHDWYLQGFISMEEEPG